MSINTVKPRIRGFGLKGLSALPHFEEKHQKKGQKPYIQQAFPNCRFAFLPVSLAHLLQFGSQVDMYGLEIGVSGQAGLAQFAADAALLDAAKGDLKARVIAAIDPDHAGFDPTRHPMRAREVLSEDGAAQAVRGVVGALDRLLLAGEAGNHDKGAEDFFPVDFHVVLNVGEDGGLDEEALAVAHVLVRFSPHEQRCAFRFARFDVGQHALVLGLGDLRAVEGVFSEGIANLADVLHILLEQ